MPTSAQTLFAGSKVTSPVFLSTLPARCKAQNCCITTSHWKCNFIKNNFCIQLSYTRKRSIQVLLTCPRYGCHTFQKIQWSSPAKKALTSGPGAYLCLPHFRTSISICVLYGPISVGLRTRASCQRHRLKSLQDAKPLTLSSTSRPPDCWAFLRSFEDLEGTPHIHSLKILRGK